MRLVHLSDIHLTLPPRRFGFRHLLGKRVLGWGNLWLGGRFARFRDADTVVRAFVADLDEVAPDAVLFSGDVTSLSLDEEFEAGSRALAPLLQREVVVGIPGNHDTYLRGPYRDRHFSRRFGAWERTDRPDLADAGWHPYPIVRFLGDRVCVLAVQSARPRPLWDSSGEIGEAQLAALERALRDPEVASRVRLLMLHYGVLRHTGEPDTRHHGLRDGESLLRVARAGGVSAILHGHLHRRFIHKDPSVTPVPLLCVGSLTDLRHERAYHVYEVREGALAIRVRRFDPATARFYDVTGDAAPTIPFCGAEPEAARSRS